jgi:hypothetical protein
LLRVRRRDNRAILRGGPCNLCNTQGTFEAAMEHWGTIYRAFPDHQSPEGIRSISQQLGIPHAMGMSFVATTQRLKARSWAKPPAAHFGGPAMAVSAADLNQLFTDPTERKVYESLEREVIYAASKRLVPVDTDLLKAAWNSIELPLKKHFMAAYSSGDRKLQGTLIEAVVDVLSPKASPATQSSGGSIGPGMKVKA